MLGFVVWYVAKVAGIQHFGVGSSRPAIAVSGSEDGIFTDSQLSLPQMWWLPLPSSHLYLFSQ